MKFFKKNFWIVLILIIASLLRFLAVKPGYNQYHGDETAVWGSASLMVKNNTLDPGRYDYPATAMLINVFFYKIFFIPLFWIKYFLTNIGQILDGTVKIPLPPAEVKRVFGIYIIGIREINSLFWSRYVTALFGVGSVFLTYILSKKIFSEKVGLLAALFLTFNYRNVVNSHITLPDIYNAFFILLALIFYWNLYKKQTRYNYFMAGLFAGIAFSIKYQYFAIVPLILVHLVTVFKNKFSIKKLFNQNIIMSGLVLILVFLLTNPYFFMNLETVIVGMNDEFRKYGMGTNTLNLYPLSYLYHIDYGATQFFLVIVGLFIGLAKKPFKTLFLLSFVAPSYYMFIYYSHGGFYVRNFIPTTPILLIFASVAVWSITDYIKRKLGKNISVIFLSLVVLATLYVPARNSIISTYGYTRTWGYESLLPWIKENLPSDVVVGVHPFDKSNLQIKNKTTDFSPNDAYSLAEHIENGDSYVVVNLNWASLPFYFWMNYDFDEAKLLWNKPVKIMQDTFFGLAAQELFRYQVHTQSKPWQSPDAHFVIVKVPDWPKVNFKEVTKFSFDKDGENWEIYNSHNKSGDRRYQYDPLVGHIQKGSLTLIPGGERFPTTRITSDPIPVDGGYLYKVSAYLKTDLVMPLKEREGFIRLDFYDQKNNIEEKGITTSVSARVYGTSDWIKKEIVDRAPNTAKYMTVSFQSYATAVTKIWVDDFTISKSISPVVDITSSAPYTKDQIDENYLFPNSHGNL